MNDLKTYGTVLKRFQIDAVNNGTAVLKTCLTELGKLKKTSNSYTSNRKLVISDAGSLLFEAPTGSGKTLMAGHIVEKITLFCKSKGLPGIIWFWFAPYTGLIDQAIRTINTEFVTLCPKNPSFERDVESLKSGDVFVTTWASVAVINEASRKARKETELMPSIDQLIEYAKAKGYYIGAVVDEAHHSFRGQTQAFDFYNKILSPELTILITATPRDKDIDSFKKETSILNLRKITVSRQQAIEDNLIKEGVKVAVFKVPSDLESLIDFKLTALKQGVATHQKIKEKLSASGQAMVPLMLVQVDSDPNSVEQTIHWLKGMGFRTDGNDRLIRVHTADEPDRYLSAIAADESVEVLIFKMAVATGFDAPRAFTLVSFRTSRDEDFGVQIVGRILRVDRRLQNIPNLMPELNYGYVFLSDNSNQTGLTNAAQRINQVKTELAPVASNVKIIDVDYSQLEMNITNTVNLYTDSKSEQDTIDIKLTIPQNVTSADNYDDFLDTKNSLIQESLFSEWGFIDVANEETNSQNSNDKKHKGHFRYDFNTSLGVPTTFKKAVLSVNNIDIVRQIVGRFRFDEKALLVAQQNATSIIKEEVEIFGNKKERPEEIRADLAQKEIDAKAQLVLLTADDLDVVNIRELHTALGQQLYKEAERRGIDHLFNTEEKLRDGLHKILALRPEQLRRSISETVSQYTISKDAEEIPRFIFSFEPLEPARLNIYGVFPSDLNSWERPFAEYLDNDVSGTILWWHRNPVRKPFSVSIPLPGQPDFYPDFIVGVEGRSRGNGMLLIETKRIINDQERNALVKAQAEHPDYAKVMMTYWDEQREWRVVEYSSTEDRNYLDRLLRTELLVTY
ncbi:DEAD/DEAH box helicase [Paenibacillus sp. NPDC056579]|uniref:DEAD/DEAH box helicase n=1 Tax=Paenibacillus sp. NPDC056579 TaxID=3345871 RepID=UPI0036A7F031